MADKLAERDLFIDETRFPLTITEDPFWDYHLELYDPYYGYGLGGLKQTYAEFQKAVETTAQISDQKFAGGPTQYRGFIKALIKKAVAVLQENKLTDLGVAGAHKPQNRGHQLYKNDNAGKYFISIDLAYANFNVLRMINPLSVLGAPLWADFLEKVHGSPLPRFVVENKLYRQTIIGMVYKGELQQVYNDILCKVQQHLQLPAECYAVFLSDELFIECQDEVEARGLFTYVHKKAREFDEPFSAFLKVKLFKLTAIHGKNIGFVHTNMQGTHLVRDVEFKCIPPVYLPQYIRYFNKQPLTDKDLYFKYDDNLAKFMQPLCMEILHRTSSQGLDIVRPYRPF